MKPSKICNPLCLLLILVLSSCTGSKQNEKNLGKVERQDVVQRVSLNGSLRGLKQSQIQAAYAGYVGKIHVKVGQVVKEQAPLVSIIQTINQPLREVFPIRAPFSGTVTQILKQEGEYVTSGGSESNSILVIVDLSQIWIDATIPEVDISKVSLELPAVIQANALPGKKYNGLVKTISLSPKQSQDRWDRGRVEYPCQIQITDPDEALRPGMTVVADVISAKAENVLTLKHEYIRKDKDGFFVVDSAGKNHRIEAGLSNEDIVEIQSGAVEGLMVEMIDFSKL